MTNLPKFPTNGPDACPYCSQELGLGCEVQEVEAGIAYSCKACHNILYFVSKDPSSVDLGRNFANEEDESPSRGRQQSVKAVPDGELMAGAIETGLVPAGLKAYYRIMGLWGIGREEASLLLGYDHRPGITEIGSDQLKQISLTLGIYKALHTLLPHAVANEWVRKPNTAELFKGRPALDLLHTGLAGFEAVRIHLEKAL